MSNKTINQALKDLFIGLGGDPAALADNDTVSDYIADLESAIKACASGESEDLIDDTASSKSKTYSSDKIESLIPEPASGYSETVIFEGELSTLGETTGTLDEAISNYDAIILITDNADPDSGNNYLTPSPYIPTSNLVGIQYMLEYGVNDSSAANCKFKFTNGTTIVWGAVVALKKVIGVTF